MVSADQSDRGFWNEIVSNGAVVIMLSAGALVGI